MQSTQFRLFAPGARLRRVGAWLVLALVLPALPLAAQPPGKPADKPPEGPVATLLRARLAQAQARQGPGDDITGLLAAFYAHRDFAPAWTDTARVDALLAQLQGLYDDGLDPAGYGLAQLKAQARNRPADDAARARLDWLASSAYLQAIADLYRGKVDPRTISPDWHIERPSLVPQDLQFAFDAVDQGTLAAAFERARPQHPLYVALRRTLQRERAQAAAQGPWPLLPDGPTLKPGMHDVRVALLRQRLAEESTGPESTAPEPAPADPAFYDDALEQAVKAFQQAHYLTVDGSVGKSTRTALNVPRAARIDQLRVNLERARWLLHALGNDLLVVDVAGFQLVHYVGAQAVWSSRVQVGRPIRRTPLMTSEIRYLTFNPTWTVPPTILLKDVLPKVRRNIAYLARNRIRVFDAQGQEVDPASVDWRRPGGLTLRQDSGADNSLGRIVFRFPNPYGVYLHDTPHRELFRQGQRAFSSGCIRVEKPYELAQMLLDDPQHWDRAAIDAAVASGKTTSVYFKHPMPILIAYWTVHLLPDGGVAYKSDIYDLDAPTLAALDAPHVFE